MSAADNPRSPEGDSTTIESLAPDGDLSEPASVEPTVEPDGDDTRRAQSWTVAVLVGMVVALLISLIAVVGANERSDRSAQQQMCEAIGAHRGPAVGQNECRRIMRRMQERIDRAHERIGSHRAPHGAHPDMARPAPRGERNRERPRTASASRGPHAPRAAERPTSAPAPERAPVR